MAEWNLAEVVRLEPEGNNLLGGLRGPQAHYLIYGDGKGKQKLDAQQVEGFIRDLLNDGWEPMAITEARSPGLWGRFTWSFKKKIE